MTNQIHAVDQLPRENEDVRRRLEEAEEIVRAIRAGEVDAVMIEAELEQVYILEAPDSPCRLLVTQMSKGAATLTTEGTIIHCNQRFADLLGRPIDSLFGQPLQGLVTPESRPLLEALLQDGQSAGVRGEITLQRADGALLPAYLGVKALQAGARGLCLLVTDLTEQRHYEELQRTQAALRAASERLELTQQAGRIGTFEWNIRTGAINWSIVQEDLYGLPAGGFGGRYEDWKQAVHPGDRDRAEADVLRAIAERTELETQFRIVRRDGETRWIAVKAKVFCGIDGEPLRMLGVNLDITEGKRAEAALRDADRKKDEFLAILAHELRSPLAPIRNALQVLNDTSPPHPNQQWAWNVLDRQVQMMARLVDDLYDVSRVSRDKLALRKERIELAAVLEAAMETSYPLIETAGHEFTVNLPPEPIQIDADPVRLTQVFVNLLGNAAKYVETGGRICLSAERQGDDVVVSIEDDGIGIAAEMLPHVFEIFSQERSAAVRSQVGLGVGLSLVKGLVELHGGKIEARSDGPGRGSEFIVRLPVAREMPVERPAAPRGDRTKEPGKKCRILVADDCRDSTDTFAMLLRARGYEVGTAYDGEQTMEAARALRPDVLVLDIGMPELNGYEICRRIREQPWGEGVFLVALTGWGQGEDRRRAKEAGFDHHMVKPMDLAELMQILASLSSAKGGRPTKP